MSNLREIPVSKVREASIKLREVNKETEEYRGLVESIRRRGVMNPINVRSIEPTDEGFEFEVVDGTHRFEASKDAGRETIPCKILDIEQGEVGMAQIVANVHKIETKPVAYSRALAKILNDNPLMTSTELATLLAKSTSWLNLRLNLKTLHEKIGQMVDDGEIKLANAYALSKLPVEEQLEFLDAAASMEAVEFTPMVNTRIKELRDAAKQGRDPAERGKFIPTPHLQKMADIIGEIENGTVAQSLLNKFQVSDPTEAFKLALQWSVKLDPDSLEAAEKRHEERKKEQAEAREAATTERKKKQYEEATKKSEKLREELGITA